MLLYAIVTILALVHATQAATISSFRALENVKLFADRFIGGKNNNEPIFEHDVVVNVQVLRTLYGEAEASIFLFDLFNPPTSMNGQSLIGRPIAYDVLNIAIENGIVGTSVSFQLQYDADMIIPVRSDLWFRYSPNGLISHLDIAFRDWTRIMERVTQHRLKGLQASANATTREGMMQSYLIDRACKAATTFCLGQNQQYDSYDSCVTGMSGLALGDSDRLASNSSTCRVVHAPLAGIAPDLYCSAFAVNNRFCTDDHVQETFSLLGPILPTAENKQLTQGIKFSNGVEISPLLEMQMYDEKIVSWDPTWYPVGFVVYWAMLYAMAKGIEMFMTQSSAKFTQLGLEHRKNVIIYILTIFVTLMALATQLVSAPAFGSGYELSQIRAVRAAGVLVSGLYLFELSYRLSMRWPLLCHHFITVFVISLGAAMSQVTQNPSFVITACIWLFQATTEQLTFIGLIGYRLRWNARRTSMLLKVATVQTTIVKVLSSIGVLVVWGLRDREFTGGLDIFWTTVVWICAIGLMLTQVWGSWVTWKIAERLIKRDNEVALDRPSLPTSDSWASADSLEKPVTEDVV